MSKPYIVCHMMMSIDGRIDCGMTVQLAGNSEYYETLAALDAPTRVSGRVTAQLEMASGEFHATGRPLGREGMASTFDGLPMNRRPVPLKLESTTPYEDGAVWLRYSLGK